MNGVGLHTAFRAVLHQCSICLSQDYIAEVILRFYKIRPSLRISPKCQTLRVTAEEGVVASLVIHFSRISTVDIVVGVRRHSVFREAYILRSVIA